MNKYIRSFNLLLFNIHVMLHNNIQIICGWLLINIHFLVIHDGDHKMQIMNTDQLHDEEQCSSSNDLQHRNSLVNIKGCTF